MQVVFKSSPFGTQSHGYEANNSFLLWAYGKRLLIRSGYRDSYGSTHHREWMWSTRSVNNITVNGQGQGRRTAKAQGELIAFKTTPDIDIVVGEAGQAYDTPLKRFTRPIIFVKPELMIVYDRLEALGLAVTVVDDDACSAADAEGKDLIFVSSTVSSNKVGTKYRDIAIPLITYESYLFDDMKLTGTALNVDYGSFSGENSVVIGEVSHPLTADKIIIDPFTSRKENYFDYGFFVTQP